MGGRQVITRFEADVDRCANVFGVSPCTGGRKDSGTAQAGSATTLQLRAGASAVDDAYNAMTARLADGRERRILDYVGATKTATTEKRWPTNLILRAEEFDHAAWGKTGGGTGAAPVVTANTAQAPDGTMTADRIQFSQGAGVAGGDFSIIGQSGGALTTPAASVYLKSNDGNNHTILVRPSTASGFTAFTVTPVWQRCSVLSGLAGSTFQFGQIGATKSGDTADVLAWGGQLEDAADIGDYVRSLATAIALPDGTTDYTIIDRPNACYTTHRSCQDKPNYARTVQTLRYVKREDPIDLAVPARPYIVDVKTAPTEVNFEEGLGRRSLTEITLLDETDNDTLFDPYVLDRLAPAGGTHLRRFMARNLNFANRPARIVRTEVIDDVAGTPQTERFITDGIKGPRNGKAIWALKDPTKALDRTKTPVPTTGKLLAPLGVNDLQATLEAGDGAQYSASGWFRHNDEVIRYTNKVGDVLSWPDGTYRGQFGTDGMAGKAGDVLQQCRVWIDQAFSTVLKDLFNEAGMPDGDLDVAELLAEEATWLGSGYRITACLVDPTANSELAKELLVFAGMSSWWSPADQKQRFKVYAPASPAALVPTLLSDDAHLLLDSVGIERLDDKRITRCTVFYGLSKAIANREQKNYLIGDQVIDTSAEGANEYDQVIDRVMNSRFFGAANRRSMGILVRRLRARYRDAPEDIEFHCDPKDMDINAGDTVDLITARYVDFSGNPKKVRVIVTKKNTRPDRQTHMARITAFGDRRYGFIAPSGTPNYPGNNGYACVTDSAGRMSDGSDGYLVF